MLLLSTTLVLAQVPATPAPSAIQAERLNGLSSWYIALDGFLADTSLKAGPGAGYKAWVKWLPASGPIYQAAFSAASDAAGLRGLADLMEPLSQTESAASPVISPKMLLQASAQQALDELAMISFGSSARADGLIPVAHLKIFTAAAASLLSTQMLDSFADAAELYNGINPLRVLLSFLAALNVKDREIFRLLAGIELDHIFSLLDFSGNLDRDQYGFRSSQEGLGTNEASPGKTPAGNHQADFGSSPETSQRVSETKSLTLMDAERLLVSWRSSRLRSMKLQQGSLAHAAARAETGKYLAALLDTEYGELVFRLGWAGENFVEDAKKDLNEAWSAIGRAVAVDLRREAAPWLGRRLGVSNIPAFNLEYTVQPSPANPFMGLMTMRAVVNGVSYGIPHQIADRALNSAASAYFDDAPVPLRYVEEPLPGLRVYVPRSADDSSRAIAELAADLSAAYPAVLRVPAILVHIPLGAESSCEEVCIALDGAYREAATGVRLAKSFTALLYEKGYPGLDSLILLDTRKEMESILDLYGSEPGDATEKQGW